MIRPAVPEDAPALIDMGRALSDVAPSLPAQHVSHGAMSNPQGSGHFPIAHRPLSDHSDIVRCKLCDPARFPARLSASQHLVRRVVARRSEPHVSDVDAGSHVAGVANLKAGRDRAVCQLPRCPVRASGSPLIANISVSGICHRPNPKHTTVSGWRGRMHFKHFGKRSAVSGFDTPHFKNAPSASRTTASLA